MTQVHCSRGPRFQLFGVETFSSLPKCQSNDRDLARQRQTSHLRLHALGQQGRVEIVYDVSFPIRLLWFREGLILPKFQRNRIAYNRFGLMHTAAIPSKELIMPSWKFKGDLYFA